MTTALLLIDIQNDYFKNGRMVLENSDSAALNAGRLLSFFREHALPVFHVQHLSLRQGATFFIPHTSGAEFYKGVLPSEGETVVQKHFPNSFRETTLSDHLLHSKVERLVVAGMMTHMCVDTTVRAAVDLGFQCIIAHDACATRDLVLGDRRVVAADVQTAFMAALDGVFGKVLTVDEIILLLNDAFGMKTPSSS
ncbi:MAG: cysteine hydrolase [Deltaproteobacteria bacterium]|nr:cysteine hydrolase [Deltaproteobacteria bacterium]